jgi:B12 binding protein
MRAIPPVVLYQPDLTGTHVPLSLLHVGSAVGGRVLIVDGRLEMAPAARVAELAASALCLGVTTPTGPSLLDALEVSRAAKAVNPKLPVLWGGPHATHRTEECLATGVVDACVIGPGERTLVEIVDALRAGGAEQGIPGVAWKRDGESGEIVRSLERPPEDVNHLPPADYGLIDVERHFRFRGARRLEVCCGRSYELALPEPAQASDERPLARSSLTADRVLALVEELAHRFKVAEVVFADPGFFLDPERALRIARGLLAARVRQRWEASAEGVPLLPDEAWALLAESGCRRVQIFAGQAKEEALLEIAHALGRAGIAARIVFLAGSPGEAAPDRALYKSARALRSLAPTIETVVRLYDPYPGSPRASWMSGSAFARLSDLGAWASLTDDERPRPWQAASVSRMVGRWNFYLERAFAPRPTGAGARCLRWLARGRVAVDFFGLDWERQALMLWRRLREFVDRRDHEPGSD